MLLTSKCASRHNGVHFLKHLNFQKCSERGVLCTFWLRNATTAHFFNISTSKSAPNPSVFNTFDFQMCFAPQRLGLFRHLNVQKCSDTCQFLTLLTSKCASRHNGVQFFISHLAKWLRTRRFSEPTFRSGVTNHWKKHSESRLFTFLPFSRTCIFFLLTLSLLWSSLLLSDSAHLCFSIWPYCRKFDF